jgi:hypothetical protein
MIGSLRNGFENLSEAREKATNCVEWTFHRSQIRVGPIGKITLKT